MKKIDRNTLYRRRSNADRVRQLLAELKAQYRFVFIRDKQERCPECGAPAGRHSPCNTDQ